MNDEDFVRTLVGEEMTQYEADTIIKTIESLKAENDALREKLGVLDKVPCKIGDTIYVLFGACYKCEKWEGDYCSCEKKGKDKVFEMKIGSIRFNKDDYYLYEDSIGVSEGLSCASWNYGKTWFLSREEAEAHLLEREGEKC